MDSWWARWKRELPRVYRSVAPAVVQEGVLLADRRGGGFAERRSSDRRGSGRCQAMGQDFTYLDRSDDSDTAGVARRNSYGLRGEGAAPGSMVASWPPSGARPQDGSVRRATQMAVWVDCVDQIYIFRRIEALNLCQGVWNQRVVSCGPVFATTVTGSGVVICLPLVKLRSVH